MESKNSPFGFDKPEDSPGFLLWQTTTLWQREIKKILDKADISHSQFVILAILLWLRTQGVEITQVVIISLSKLDKMTVSKSLKKLSSLGYINRKESNIDTRAKSVNLTTKGVNFITKLVPLVEDVDQKFFSKLSKSNENTLINLLNKLV